MNNGDYGNDETVSFLGMPPTELILEGGVSAGQEVEQMRRSKVHSFWSKELLARQEMPSQPCLPSKIPR